MIKPGIVAMNSPHSLVRCDNKARPFSSVPLNVPDDDPIGKLRMIHRQTTYDSVVLMHDTGVILGSSTKDTRLKRGLSIDDQ